MQPTAGPTAQPSTSPSTQPSKNPSAQPTNEPSGQPTHDPSGQPSASSSAQPTAGPTTQPSGSPSGSPSGTERTADGKTVGATEWKPDHAAQKHATLHNFACGRPPGDIELTAQEQKQFRSVYASQGWEDAVRNQSVLNAMDACAALKIGGHELYELWERAEAKVRLRRGLHIARIDRNCAVDPQEFYTASAASTDCFICEWDEAATPWSQLRSNVIGTADPASASADSLRGSLLRQWEALGMETQPNLWCNGVHVSASSAFEGLAERLLWKRGSMLYTDLFGSRLLSARIKSTLITEWPRNPPVAGGALLFDLLSGLNSADCIADPAVGAGAGKK